MTDTALTGRTPLGRRFIAVWAGQTLSSIGSTLSGVGIGIWIFLESGSAAWLGVLVARGEHPACARRAAHQARRPAGAAHGVDLG